MAVVKLSRIIKLRYVQPKKNLLQFARGISMSFLCVIKSKLRPTSIRLRHGVALGRHRVYLCKKLERMTEECECFLDSAA